MNRHYYGARIDSDCLLFQPDDGGESAPEFSGMLGAS